MTAKTVHIMNRIGLSTLCEKDPARCQWVKLDDTARATCARCIDAAFPSDRPGMRQRADGSTFKPGN